MNRKQRRAAASTGDLRFAQADRLLMSGRAGEAEALYRAILADDPRHDASLHRLGLIAHQAGRADLAVQLLGAAIAIDAKAAPYHAHLGLALAALGHGDAAVASCRTAMALDARAADIPFNLGVVLAARGELDAAADAYREAVRRDPALLDAHAALGGVLMARGHNADAAASFEAAFHLAPDQPDVLADLALARLALGDNDAALAAILKSLRLRETAQNRRIFVHVVKDMTLHDAAELRPLLLRALDWTRPDEMARVCADALRDAPLDDPLLLALLVMAPSQDVALEARLVAARGALLRKSGDAITPFDSALAQQCFINEYVFPQDDAAPALRDQLAAALDSGAVIDPRFILAMAACHPLSSLPNAQRLLDTSWPPEVEAVLTQQLREPAQERRLEIPRLTEIADPVSRAVQQQYEENPYPRWVRLGPAPQPVALIEYLRRKFPLTPITGSASGAEILVAGCGTGRNAIETAQQIAGAQVLAIDLSRASLAHAARKTPPGLAITYAQADLLALELPQRFDLIEAIGVLHHLADPFAGWRALLRLLKPGGFMHIGVYSSAARSDLDTARTLLDGSEDIRTARQKLIAAGSPITARPDFFTTSTCRDLLFHVQEHRLALPDIAAFLRDEGLGLLGFDVDETVLIAYQRQFPGDPAATDLQNWHLFEQENPATFAGMYHFWVRKV